MIATDSTIGGLDAAALNIFVDAVLAEDIGVGGDLTTQLTVTEVGTLSGLLHARQDAVIAGVDLAAAFFERCDPDMRIERRVCDGARVNAGDVILALHGNARAILTAERSALNTLQHLTGIATMTRRYVDAIEGTGCTLLDTRKTIPGLRVVEKYASRVGGARIHRIRLDDGILIKDNHVAFCGSIADAVRRAKAGKTGLPVQAEVDAIEQIEPALGAGADRLLCDNMPPVMLREAVALVAGRVPIEASGGITLDTIREVAMTGVDFVSVGRITQSAPAADIGLDYSRPE